jgi:hypothetical protein
MISTKTIQLIEKLKGAPWFQQVGEPVEDESVLPIYTWREAMKLCLSLEWENTCLDAENGLSGILARDHRAQFQKWNMIVHAINERLQPTMEDVAREAIRQHELSGDFTQVLVSTTRMACVEMEYSKLLPPAFFSEIASWYLVGHLPCGLTGKYPDGILIVF